MSLKRAARTAKAATRAREARDQAIRDAATEGNTVRAIAAVTGLSSARIHQIIHGR